MPGPNDLLSKGLVATTPIPKFHAVKLVGEPEQCAVADTAGELVVGICQEEIVQEDVDDGRHVAVRIIGMSMCIAGAAIDQQTEVAVAADGRVVTAAAGNRVLGVTMNAAAQADDWVPVLLTPAGQTVPA